MSRATATTPMRHAGLIGLRRLLRSRPALPSEIGNRKDAKREARCRLSRYTDLNVSSESEFSQQPFTIFPR